MERDPLEEVPPDEERPAGDEAQPPAGDEEPLARGEDDGAGDEDRELTPEEMKALRDENRRLKASNDSLTKLREDHEQLRDEYDELLGEREQPRRRQKPAARGGEAGDDDDEGNEVPQLTKREWDELEKNPAVTRALGVLAASHRVALAKVRRELRDVQDRVQARVPLQDERAVDRLMESGEFKSRRGAKLALEGLRARKAAQKAAGEQRRAAGDDDDGEERPPSREPARRPAVATTRRGLTPRAREQAGVVTIAEHRRRMDRDGPGYDQKYVERYRAGAVKVVKRER